MPLIELICKNCGAVSEELVRADGDYPNCKKCGHKLEQKYNGKCYVSSSSAKKGGGCGGNCANCKGCGGV